MRHPTRAAMLAALLMVSASACSSSDADDIGPDAGAVQVPPPTLERLTPDAVSLGDRIKVFGADFVPPELGEMLLVLEGTYTDDQGEAHDYSGSLPLEYVNSGQAELAFERLWFLPLQDRIGVFKGQAHIVASVPSVVDDSLEDLESESVKANIRVLPSIVIERLRTVDPESDCADVTRGTNPGYEIELRAAAIGAGTSSSASPWNFSISYLTPQMAVRYVKNDAYDLWPFDGPIDDDIAAEAPEGANKMTFRLTQGAAIHLDPRATPSTVRINPPVTIGQQVHDEVVVESFAAGPIDGPGVNYATLVLELNTGEQTLQRLITYEVWNLYEITDYNGETRMVERFAPQQTSGCFSGGDIGRDLNYTEGQSESRSRSLSFRWDVNVAQSLGINLGKISSPIQVNGNVTWSQTFGIDVSESLSSEVHQSLNLSAHILPTYFGTCYRQTEKLERDVDVIYHNACGATGVVGQTVLTDWSWGFDIATGPDCPPETNLPGPM